MSRPYPKYRDSGVEWLGEVPEHWEACPARRRFDIVNGGTPKSGIEAYWDGKAAWITPDDLGQNDGAWISEGRRNITEDGVANSSAHISPAGSIVLSTRAPIGHLAILAAPAATNQGCRTLVPNHDMDSRFAYYSFSASRPVIQSLGKGSTFMELSASDLGDHPIPLPTLAEQRAIAEFLDRQTSKIDTLVERKRLLIERLSEYRTALVTRTVTRGLPPAEAEAAGLDPNPPMRGSGVEWLGEVPDHWAVTRLKWSVDGIMNGVWGDEADGENDIPCVRVADFDRRKLRVQTVIPTIRAIPPRLREDRQLRVGDLLLEKSGGGEHQLVGCVVLYDLDTATVSSNFIARISSPEGADPRFWRYVHAALYAGRLNYPAIKKTTGIQNLDVKAYLDTPTVFPPLCEQSAIADFLDRRTTEVDALCARVEAAIERLQEYRTALVTAAVTGKIDVRGAVDAELEGCVV